MRRPKIRCYYARENHFIRNLGDILVPSILKALGYDCVSTTVTDVSVINPGRCLLVIGSLLTRYDLEKISWPIDIWGCGWKGLEAAPIGKEGLRYYAVRGPQTAAGLSLSQDVALGDPALLLPYLMSLPAIKNGKTMLLVHIDRVRVMSASRRCFLTGCDEVLTTLVLPPAWYNELCLLNIQSIAALARLKLLFGIRVYALWDMIRKIVGAEFVLTGSLHGAILAQSYQVPWACFCDDGFVDAPAKWHDWAEYLGVKIEFVRTLKEGRQWWQRYGCHGRIRSLRPLLDAFPYPILNKNIKVP